MSRRLRVAVTQPYVPEYRVKLFERVNESLEEANVELRVFYPTPTERRIARGDLRTTPWTQEVPGRIWRTRIGPVARTRLPDEWRRPDLLVTELAAGNLQAWSALIRRVPYVLWGHGPSSTTGRWPAKDYAEKPLIRGAKHTITYLPRGRDAVLALAGCAPSSVTAYLNSTDTSALRAATAAVDPNDQLELRNRLDICDSSLVALYVGSLDTSKRVDLLVETAEIAAAAEPNFRLVLAGRGPDEERVKEAARRTRAINWVGYADRNMLASLAMVSHALLIPGRVGLVAVDALALGLPIVTTSDASHAPEIQYLSEGSTVFYSEGRADNLAELLLRVVRSRSGKPRQLPDVSGLPSIERSSQIMTEVILDSLRR